MCVYMCIMNLHVYGMCIYIFMFSLYLLGLITTMSFYLYPILRFNKADCLYLQSLSVGGCCTVWDCVIARSPECVADWYMYLCMYFGEGRRFSVTVRFYYFREKWICHNILIFLIHLNLPFGSVMLSSCIPFIV